MALVKGFESEASIPSFNRNILVLEAVIAHQLDAPTAASPSFQIEAESPERQLEVCLRITTQVRLLR